MGMGGNGNYFSGINGNGNKVSEFRSPGMGVGMKSWDCEGMVCQKLFPHTSTLHAVLCANISRTLYACQSQKICRVRYLEFLSQTA